MKPFVGIIKDTHMKTDNKEQVINIFEQFIAVLKANNIKYAIHLGDLFDERKGGHTIERMVLVGMTIRLFVDAEIELHVIPGNHDKTNLDDTWSYLNTYTVVEESPYFKLHSAYEYVDFKEQKVRMHFIPYFTEGEPYMEQITAAKPCTYKPGYKQVLCTHIAINGVRNNDGSVVETGIPASVFSGFDLVLVGHYHDYSEIPPNIYYLPGAYQINYGENNYKGFTLLAADMSMKVVGSKFKEFKQIKIQASDKAAMKEVLNELKTLDPVNQNVRVKIVGSSAELESVDVSQLKALQVDIRYENNTEVSVDFETEEEAPTLLFTKSDLIKNYITFARENGLTSAQRGDGLKRLKQI